MKELLIELNACIEAREWAGDKSLDEIIDTCHRGDWLLWLARKVDIDKRKLTLAKALCANTVRHMMRDDRSKHAVDVAIAYGNGDATEQQLTAAAADAAAAADTDSAAAAVDAADAAAYAAASYAYATYAAYAAYAADAAYAAAGTVAADTAAYTASAAADTVAAAARTESRMKTADICREIIGNEIKNKIQCK